MANACYALTVSWVTLLMLGAAARARADGPQPADYQARCEAVVAAHAREAQKVRYLPASFEVQRWAGQAPTDGSGVGEGRVIDALKRGEVRTMLVEGRGGLGKSSLVRAIEARLCRELPVFGLDLREDVLPLMGAGLSLDEPIFEALRRGLEGQDDGLDAPDPAALVGRGAWLLMVDSLDEVTRAERERALALVEGLRGRYPEVRVVLLSRAPIFDSHNPIKGYDTRLALRLLPCEVVTRWLQEGFDDPALAQAFWERAKRTGLARRYGSPGRCVFPHLATFRDVKIARFAARAGGAGTGPGVGAPMRPATRASIYEDAVADLLFKSRLKLPVGLDVILESIDRMVLRLAPGPGTHELFFGLEECRKSWPKSVPGDQVLGICRALFLTPLFEGVRGIERWRFKNRSLTDLFMARFLDARLRGGKQPRCAELTKLGGYFEAQEVASFLVGLPNGSQCLGELVGGLCAEGCRPQDGALLLDQGIPAGDQRAATIAAARARAGKAPCAQAMLDALAAIPATLEAPP
jgi:hypothetical protein